MNDGGEVDLDLGNYERYLDVTLSRDNNITTGKIYQEVIEKEVCLRPVDHFAALILGTEKRRISWKNGSGEVVFVIGTCGRLTGGGARQIVPHVTNAIQDWIDRVSKIPVDNSGEEPDLCIVEVCAIAFLNENTSSTISSEEQSEISNPLPSLKPCGNSSFELVTITLLSFTSRSYQICMASRRQSLPRRPYMLCEGLDYFLI